MWPTELMHLSEPVVTARPADRARHVPPIARLPGEDNPRVAPYGVHLADPPTYAPPGADRCVVCEELSGALR
jgi:hypothetical protein